MVTQRGNRLSGAQVASALRELAEFTCTYLDTEEHAGQVATAGKYHFGPLVVDEVEGEGSEVRYKVSRLDSGGGHPIPLPDGLSPAFQAVGYRDPGKGWTVKVRGAQGESGEATADVLGLAVAEAVRRWRSGRSVTSDSGGAG